MSLIKKVHKENKMEKEKNIASNPCYACGELHFYNDCPKTKNIFAAKKGNNTHCKIKIKK